MIPKDMSTGARLFCYKYVLSVDLLCLFCLSSADISAVLGEEFPPWVSGRNLTSILEDAGSIPGLA